MKQISIKAYLNSPEKRQELVYVVAAFAKQWNKSYNPGDAFWSLGLLIDLIWLSSYQFCTTWGSHSTCSQSKPFKIFITFFLFLSIISLYVLITCRCHQVMRKVVGRWEAAYVMVPTDCTVSLSPWHFRHPNFCQIHILTYYSFTTLPTCFPFLCAHLLKH